jgi:hypothetical protein
VQHVEQREQAGGPVDAATVDRGQYHRRGALDHDLGVFAWSLSGVELRVQRGDHRGIVNGGGQATTAVRREPQRRRDDVRHQHGVMAVAGDLDRS